MVPRRPRGPRPPPRRPRPRTRTRSRRARPFPRRPPRRGDAGETTVTWDRSQSATMTTRLGEREVRHRGEGGGVARLLVQQVGVLVARHLHEPRRDREATARFPMPGERCGEVRRRCGEVDAHGFQSCRGRGRAPCPRLADPSGLRHGRRDAGPRDARARLSRAVRAIEGRAPRAPHPRASRRRTPSRRRERSTSPRPRRIARGRRRRRARARPPRRTREPCSPRRTRRASAASGSEARSEIAWTRR